MRATRQALALVLPSRLTMKMLKLTTAQRRWRHTFSWQRHFVRMFSYFVLNVFLMVRRHNAQNANAHVQYLNCPQNSQSHHSPSSFADSYLNNSPQMIHAPLSIFHSQNVLGLMERFKSSILHLRHSMHPATTVESAVCAESISELVLFGETRLPETTVFSSIQMQVSRGWRAWT